ncbi:aspartate/glutamate racemase family protein [Jatrophihabitans sp. DSM 45814]
MNALPSDEFAATADQPLRRIGLIGGTSWESTAIYYRLLNEAVRDRRGGSASAAVTIHSVDFSAVHAQQVAGDWAGIGYDLGRAALALQAGGAEAVAVCANTLHLVAAEIAEPLGVPFIDLIDIVADQCVQRNWAKVGLLGTGYTMRSSMYADRLRPLGIDVVVPEESDLQFVHNVIYDELTRGVVRSDSRTGYLKVISRLVSDGAQAVILGCTEIGLLLADGDAAVPLLDTTASHCEVLTAFMLDESRVDAGLSKPVTREVYR